MTIGRLVVSTGDGSLPQRGSACVTEEQLDLVAATLAPTNALEWPNMDLVNLEQRRREAVVRDLAETQMLGRVLPAWAVAGVDALIVKGAAVGRTHYPASWTRPRSDVDVLVPLAAYDRAARVLRELGLEEQPASPVHGQRHFRQRDGCRCRVDLHARLLVPTALHRDDEWERCWSRAVALPGLPAPARTLATPDALWLACVHRAVHHRDSESAVWLLDIHLLAATLDDAGWDILAATAAATRTARLCAHGVVRARTRFGTAVPAAALARLQQARGEPSEAFVGGSMPEWRIQWWNLCSVPGWSARVRIVAQHLFPPAAFIREQHHARGVAGLAWAYVRRLLVGAVRWVFAQ